MASGGVTVPGGDQVEEDASELVFPKG